MLQAVPPGGWRMARSTCVRRTTASRRHTAPVAHVSTNIVRNLLRGTVATIVTGYACGNVVPGKASSKGHGENTLGVMEVGRVLGVAACAFFADLQASRSCGTLHITGVPLVGHTVTSFVASSNSTKGALSPDSSSWAVASDQSDESLRLSRSSSMQASCRIPNAACTDYATFVSN